MLSKLQLKNTYLSKRPNLQHKILNQQEKAITMELTEISDFAFHFIDTINANKRACFSADCI